MEEGKDLGSREGRPRYQTQQGGWTRPSAAGGRGVWLGENVDNKRQLLTALPSTKLDHKMSHMLCSKTLVVTEGTGDGNI